jgi:hypothetical protein
VQAMSRLTAYAKTVPYVSEWAQPGDTEDVEGLIGKLVSVELIKLDAQKILNKFSKKIFALKPSTELGSCHLVSFSAVPTPEAIARLTLKFPSYVILNGLPRAEAHTRLVQHFSIFSDAQ